MEKLVKKWQGKVIEDCGAYASKEWQSFSRMFKNAVKRECEKRGFVLAGKKPFGQAHYFVSGFVEKGGEFYYISYRYDRYSPVDLTAKRFAGPILWRHAKSAEDYRGETNCYAAAQDLFGEIERDLAWRKKKGEQNG